MKLDWTQLKSDFDEAIFFINDPSLYKTSRRHQVSPVEPGLNEGQFRLYIKHHDTPHVQLFHGSKFNEIYSSGYSEISTKNLDNIFKLIDHIVLVYLL